MVLWLKAMAVRMNLHSSYAIEQAIKEINWQIPARISESVEIALSRARLTLLHE